MWTRRANGWSDEPRALHPLYPIPCVHGDRHRRRRRRHAHPARGGAVRLSSGRLGKHEAARRAQGAAEEAMRELENELAGGGARCARRARGKHEHLAPRARAVHAHRQCVGSLHAYGTPGGAPVVAASERRRTTCDDDAATGAPPLAAPRGERQRLLSVWPRRNLRRRRKGGRVAPRTPTAIEQLAPWASAPVVVVAPPPRVGRRAPRSATTSPTCRYRRRSCRCRRRRMIHSDDAIRSDRHPRPEEGVDHPSGRSPSRRLTTPSRTTVRRAERHRPRGQHVGRPRP